MGTVGRASNLRLGEGWSGRWLQWPRLADLVDAEAEHCPLLLLRSRPDAAWSLQGVLAQAPVDPALAAAHAGARVAWSRMVDVSEGVPAAAPAGKGEGGGGGPPMDAVWLACGVGFTGGDAWQAALWSEALPAAVRPAGRLGQGPGPAREAKAGGASRPSIWPPLLRLRGPPSASCPRVWPLPLRPPGRRRAGSSLAPLLRGAPKAPRLPTRVKLK